MSNSSDVNRGASQRRWVVRRGACRFLDDDDATTIVQIVLAQGWHPPGLGLAKEADRG